MPYEWGKRNKDRLMDLVFLSDPHPTPSRGWFLEVPQSLFLSETHTEWPSGRVVHLPSAEAEGVSPSPSQLVRSRVAGGLSFTQQTLSFSRNS